MYYLTKSRTIKLAALSPVLTAALVALQEQLPWLKESLGVSAFVLLSVVVSSLLAYIRLTHEEKSQAIKPVSDEEIWVKPFDDTP